MNSKYENFKYLNYGSFEGENEPSNVPSFESVLVLHYFLENSYLY